MRERLTLMLCCLMSSIGYAREKTAVERGKDALLGQAFLPPMVSHFDYDKLWKVWGLKEKPADFDERLRDRYGLHVAPYPNKGLPMGLRDARGAFLRGVGTDCLLCHAGTVVGQTVIGLGNTALDLQALFDEFSLASGFTQTTPFAFTNVRGTSEASASAAYLFQFRNPDLTLRAPKKVAFTSTACEDVPAWWLLKRKTTMYQTGSHSARAVRPLMSMLLNPLNSPEYIKKQEPVYRDIQAYLLSLEAPRYPFAIDRARADAGQRLFETHCVRCHGTHGPDGKYPNKVVDLDTIGTDPVLATGFPPETEEMFNRSWFGDEKPSRGQRGYQAPPLDGIWATAPYFHNGAAPTLAHVLNSKTRPKLFTRSYRTGEADFDKENVGWKYTVLDRAPGKDVPGIERRKVYDTSQPGRSNAGHPFGDRLTDVERRAIIEYLKTL